MDDNFHNFLRWPWLGLFDPAREVGGGGEDVAGRCLCCDNWYWPTAGGQMRELIKHEISLPEFIGKTTTCSPQCW